MINADQIHTCVLDSTFHLWPLHKVTLWQARRTFPPRTTFSQHFRKRRTKTFVRCWKAKALSQRSIRLAGSRWKERACSTSLKVFLVGLGFAKRVTRSTGPSFSHGRGSAAADIPKASINSWPIPLGTSCASRPVESYMYTENFLLSRCSVFHFFRSYAGIFLDFTSDHVQEGFRAFICRQSNFIAVCCTRYL